MAQVVVFHSVLGLRPAELRAAKRFRAAGHVVHTPDLYAGATAATLDDGFAIMARVGWDTIARRAADALRDLPADTVLAGFSMGAGVVDAVLPHRTGTAGVLLFHGLASVPAGTRAQLHVADPDPFAPPADVAAWRTADAQVFTYPGAGHFYTDEDLPDHDPRAAALTWRRALDFLRA
ncbi:dienelactone hydrolase family protein [Actinophytocola sp. KF-1]